jgi:hypothetical protein
MREIVSYNKEHGLRHYAPWPTANCNSSATINEHQGSVVCKIAKIRSLN